MTNYLLSVVALVSFISTFSGQAIAFSSADNNIETVADYLFRYSIFKRDAKSLAIVIDDKELEENSQNLRWLWQHLNAHPLHSPLAVTVHYADKYKTQLTAITSRDAMLVNDRAYDHVGSLRNYLETAVPDLVDAIKHGYQPDSLTFREAQQKQFIKRGTLAHEELHICGITDDIENLINSELISYLNSHSFTIVAAFYFGSRVMPRTEVVLRDPSFCQLMPINDDGVVKNAVRVKGMTAISDLEMMVVVSSNNQFTYQSLRDISRGFKKHLAKIFREFPVSLKLLQRREGDAINDPFDYVISRYREAGRKELSYHQFVKIDFADTKME